MPATRFILIALQAATALLVGPAQATPQAQADIIWGVNGHPLASYPGISIEAQLDAVRDLGMKSYRVDVGGTEDIPGLQHLVREARARGITVLPVITPKFDLDKETPEALEKKALGLAFALVTIFKGQIPVWELGNELENYAIIQPCEMQDDGTQYSCSYGPAGGRGPLEYFGPRWAKVSAVLKGLSQGAIAADPKVRRAMGTAGWGHVGAFERMKADGIEWDISVWHMYGEDPEWAFKELAKYRRPIWVTEFNHPQGSTESKEAQAEGLTQAISQLSDLQQAYGVEAAHIYELMDEPYWEGSYEAHMGLIEMKKDEQGRWTVGARKPAYEAVKAHLALGPAESAEPRTIGIRRQCEPKPAAGTDNVEMPALIGYAYCLTLGRPADGVGLDSWRARFAGGMTVEQLLIELLHSDEFSILYDVPGLSPAEYVSLVHRLLLGTEPAEEMLDRSAADIEAGKPRLELQRALIGSKAFKARHPTLTANLVPAGKAAAATAPARPKPEVNRRCELSVLQRPLQFERGQVMYGYCLVLGRWPDNLGLQSWREQLRAGELTLEGFLLGLLESGEFNVRYRTAALDDAQYVTLLYRLLLDRDPDAASLETYVSRLATGQLSREDFGKGLLTSPEFRATREALYSALNTRPVRAGLDKVQR